MTDSGRTATQIFHCSQCHHEEKRDEPDVLGGNKCPGCGCGMTAVGGFQ